jgi:hypothetical protein
MDTNDVQSGTGPHSDRDGLLDRRHVHSVLVHLAIAVIGLGFSGVVSAQGASSATGGGSNSGLYVTMAALTLTGIAIGAVYLFNWRDRPERTYTPATATEDAVPNKHTGPMYEADVASRETESVDHDVFDPVGTGLLLALYFAVIAIMWLFMYFVEFLGNGPTVVG